jgi:hypothetical protein
VETKKGACIVGMKENKTMKYRNKINNGIRTEHMNSNRTKKFPRWKERKHNNGKGNTMPFENEVITIAFSNKLTGKRTVSLH